MRPKAILEGGILAALATVSLVGCGPDMTYKEAVELLNAEQERLDRMEQEKTVIEADYLKATIEANLDFDNPESGKAKISTAKATKRKRLNDLQKQIDTQKKRVERARQLRDDLSP